MLTSVPRFMAKPGSGSGSDSNKASQNVVFVDTSLDTTWPCLFQIPTPFPTSKVISFFHHLKLFFFSVFGFCAFVLMRGFCLIGWHFGVFVWKTYFLGPNSVYKHVKLDYLYCFITNARKV